MTFKSGDATSKTQALKLMQRPYLTMPRLSATGLGKSAWNCLRRSLQRFLLAGPFEHKFDSLPPDIESPIRRQSLELFEYRDSRYRLLNLLFSLFPAFPSILASAAICRDPGGLKRRTGQYTTTFRKGQKCFQRDGISHWIDFCSFRRFEIAMRSRPKCPISDTVLSSWSSKRLRR
jgi:hypothetical protein